MLQPRSLVLASTSRYRKALLGRLGLPFECADPAVEERALPGEAPATTAARLAEAKARAVVARFPRALIIGSDQVASCGGEVLDKPGTHANAVRQLTRMSGTTACFDTAVSLCDAHSGAIRSVVVPATMTLLGRWNWYLPSWLSWLPDVHVEGHEEELKPRRAT